MTVGSASTPTALEVWGVEGHPDALLCAVALDPQRFSRNRNYAFFANPVTRRIHGRARAIRSLARQLASSMHRPMHTIVVRSIGDSVQVVCEDQAIALKRRVPLDPLELSLLRLLVAQQRADALLCMIPGPDDLARVRESLDSIGMQLPEPCTQRVTR